MGSPSYRECEKVELIGICLVMAGICANCRGLMKRPNFCFFKKKLINSGDTLGKL